MKSFLYLFLTCAILVCLTCCSMLHVEASVAFADVSITQNYIEKIAGNVNKQQVFTYDSTIDSTVVYLFEEPITEAIITEALDTEADAITSILQPFIEPSVTEPVETAANTVLSIQQRVISETDLRHIFGRLYINSVGVDVAVFHTDDITKLQAIVDAKDSACMFLWSDGNTYIADHSHQGFNKIRKCKIGASATLLTATHEISYKCIVVIKNGWNSGVYLAYNNGESISADYSNNIIMYTCNTDGTITITIWEQTI